MKEKEPPLIVKIVEWAAVISLFIVLSYVLDFLFGGCHGYAPYRMD